MAYASQVVQELGIVRAKGVFINGTMVSTSSVASTAGAFATLSVSGASSLVGGFTSGASSVIGGSLLVQSTTANSIQTFGGAILGGSGSAVIVGGTAGQLSFFGGTTTRAKQVIAAGIATDNATLRAELTGLIAALNLYNLV